MVRIFVTFVCSLLSILNSTKSNNIRTVREEFELEFHHTCSKYPFTNQFFNLLENSYHDQSIKYVAFVFHEVRYRNGGLGDRLGGLLTAISTALRFNRTLLIKSDNGFSDLFQPYHPKNLSKYTYKNIKSWTLYNYSDENNDDTEYDLWDCINVNDQKSAHCGMETGNVPQPIIKFKANRAYFCRWDRLTNTKVHEEFMSILSHNQSSSEKPNLIEAAGCMLRLALWPTEKLWTLVEKAYENIGYMENYEMKKEHSSKVLGHSHPFQIGLHFRCGDRSYLSRGTFDSQCVHDIDGSHPHQESGAMNTGNPVDIARCASQLFANHSSSVVVTEPALLFISSDNSLSTQQMKSTANFSITLEAPPGCHIELDPSADCMDLTITYWFILSLSNYIVTQGEYNHPASSFSRYASFYGLKRQSIRIAKQCDIVIDTAIASRSPQGNWFC